jgi:hypothetical protein
LSKIYGFRIMLTNRRNRDQSGASNNLYEVRSGLGEFFTTILYPLRGILRRRYSFVDK